MWWQQCTGRCAAGCRCCHTRTTATSKKDTRWIDRGVHWDDSIAKLRRGSGSHSSYQKLDLELRKPDSMILLAAVSASGSSITIPTLCLSSQQGTRQNVPCTTLAQPAQTSSYVAQTIEAPSQPRINIYSYLVLTTNEVAQSGISVCHSLTTLA